MTDEAFFDRRDELARLDELADAVLQDAPRWLAVLGPRKIGKSSLLLEFSRRRHGSGLRFALLDTTESAPVSTEFFRTYALRAVDAAWGVDVGASLDTLARTPREFAACITGAPGFAELEPGVRGFVLDLPGVEMDTKAIQLALNLPDLLARSMGFRFVVAIDEFQELGHLSGRGKKLQPFAIMRSAWQKHTHAAYVISGSGRSMLRELIASKRSPFFQHFDVMDIGPLPVDEAIELLTTASPRGRHIGKRLAKSVVELVGSNPFYVQLFGDALTRLEPPYGEDSLKAALQDVLFSRTGRLSLYFQMEFERAVGQSTYLAAVLNALAERPLRLGQLAKAIGAQPGHTSGYVDRLGDLIAYEDGLYRIDDPTFALWLRWRQPGGSTLPMTLVGDEAEREVALRLSKAGFDLVYQSRASRGAFDLLATRGAHQLGVQVKRGSLPVRLKKSEWNRMEADGERFSWRWLVAAVDPEGRVWLLDPAGAKKGREVRLGEDAEITNVLAWLDRR